MWVWVAHLDASMGPGFEVRLWGAARSSMLCCTDAGGASTLTLARTPNRTLPVFVVFLMWQLGAITCGYHRTSCHSELRHKWYVWFYCPVHVLGMAFKPTETWYETLSFCALMFSALYARPTKLLSQLPFVGRARARKV